MTDEPKSYILGKGRLFFDGGLVKPHDLGGQMPVILPYGEMILPYSDVRAIPGGEVNLMQPRESKFSVHIAVQGLERFTASLRQVQGQLRRYQDTIMFWATEPIWGSREKRVANLLRSGDRRQQKRGQRLLENWHRKQPVINFLDQHAKAVDQRLLKEFFHEKLGEPYDPTHYQKD